MTTRKAVTPARRIRRLTSTRDVSSAIATLGKRMRECASRKARIERNIAHYQAELAKANDRLTALNLAGEDAIERHTQDILEWFLDFSGNAPSVGETTFPAGTIEVYEAQTAAITFVDDNELEAIKELLRLFPERFFELVRCEMKRNDLKAEANADVLAGLTLVNTPRGAFLAIKPHGTTEVIRRSLKQALALRRP